MNKIQRPKRLQPGSTKFLRKRKCMSVLPWHVACTKIHYVNIFSEFLRPVHFWLLNCVTQNWVASLPKGWRRSTHSTFPSVKRHLGCGEQWIGNLHFLINTGPQLSLFQFIDGWRTSVKTCQRLPMLTRNNGKSSLSLRNIIWTKKSSGFGQWLDFNWVHVFNY